MTWDTRLREMHRALAAREAQRCRIGGVGSYTPTLEALESTWTDAYPRLAMQDRGIAGLIATPAGPDELAWMLGELYPRASWLGGTERGGG